MYDYPFMYVILYFIFRWPVCSNINTNTISVHGAAIIMSLEDKNDLAEQIKQLQQLVGLQVTAMKAQTELLQASTAHPYRDTTLATTSQQQPKVVRQVKVPEGRYNMNLTDFRTYKKDCVDYQKLTSYSDEQVVLQMRLNMDSDLKRAVDTNFRDRWDTLTVMEAIDAIGEIVNQISNPAVYRKEFDHLNQLDDESVKEFITRLKACAIDCNFVCPHDANHDLTDYHIINRIRSGVSDKVLQQELLQKVDELDDLTSISIFCESFESTKRDKDKLSNSDTMKSTIVNAINAVDRLTDEEIVAAISTYKRQKNNLQPNGERNQKKCSYCGYDYHSKMNCPAQGKVCNKCGKRNHFEQVCRTKKNVNAVLLATIEMIVGSSSTHTPPKLPEVQLSISHGSCSPHYVSGIADTGAQVTVAGPSLLKQLQISAKMLYKPALTILHVGGNTLSLIGTYDVKIHHNNKICETTIYFVNGVKSLYLSLDVCKRIGLVHEEFPNIDTSKLIGINSSSCQVPPRPSELPYPPTEENIEKLEKWLLDAFSETAFNVDAEPLPVMAGKPHHIHLTDDAELYAANTPIPIPHHWKKEVKEQLDQDEEMGIIRKVPVGEATEWCMRMVTVPKKDGSPRRTIDFQHINKFCKREAHHTPRPFDAVSSIPPHTYKTTLDAFNGYHQVPLDEESVKLTTFITELGRYQYLRAPQGHSASGDAYTRRYDDILKEFPRKKKIVDDVLLYDFSIEESFYHTFDCLCLCTENGVTITPKKFKFSRKEVDFVGFNVGWESYMPSDDMLNAIRNFPMPEEPNISDIRSWFGLVNQLAPFLATAPFMEPFRELLKPTRARNKKVYWDLQLKKIFEDTRDALCELSTKGLAYFDITKSTMVVTDWSKQGIGFVVMQKHCNCSAEYDAFCCSNGWRLAFYNSRHLTPAESNYFCH